MLISLLALRSIYKGKASLNLELTDSGQLASQVRGLQLNSHTCRVITWVPGTQTLVLTHAWQALSQRAIYPFFTCSQAHYSLKGVTSCITGD